MLSALILMLQAGDWPAFGNDAGGSRFVQLDQINKANVSQLKPAWTFRTGELANEPGKGPASNWEATPIMVDGTLYFPTPKSVVFAVDAATGTKKWSYDPKVDATYPAASEPMVSRGVAYWQTGKTVFFGTYDARLLAIDAATGTLQSKFADKGFVDLRAGLGKIPPAQYVVTSPPTIIGNTVIVGSCISDNQSVESPSGIIRAFDAASGALKWTWDPLGRPPGKPSTKAPYLPGSANAWSIMSADPERDLVFIPTGSQAPDFFGGLRPGDDLGANSITALRASTGEQVWTFQVVHHDLWDYDVPAQPILAMIKDKPALIAMTKMGNVYVLDRLTGRPILPVEERAVPASDVSGEVAAKTQPFPVKPAPLVPQGFSLDDVWGVDDRSKRFVEDKVKGKHMGGVFTPPSLAGTVLFPGDIGGCNWSGGSYDPSSSTLFVNTNRIATVVTLIPQKDLAAARKANPGVEISSQTGAPFGMRRDWLFGPNLVPGNKPPWGVLSAVDLSSGDLKWERPLGAMPALAGIKGSSDFGSINLGGSFATSTGLVFIAASQDEHLRAFDASTGTVVWKAKLPAGGNAAPMSYSVNGKQYVVICAGGHHALRTRYGDYLIAYALP